MNGYSNGSVTSADGPSTSGKGDAWYTSNGRMGDSSKGGRSGSNRAINYGMHPLQMKYEKEKRMLIRSLPERVSNLEAKYAASKKESLSNAMGQNTGFGGASKITATNSFDDNTLTASLGGDPPPGGGGKGTPNLTDVGNVDAGVGYVAGAVGNHVGGILQNRSAYGTPHPETIIKTPAGNLNVSTNTLSKTGSVLKGVGNAAGIGGLAITYIQLNQGQISGTEAALDATFGTLGLIPEPLTTGLSITYFGTKAALQYSGSDFWNWKIGPYGSIIK